MRSKEKRLTKEISPSLFRKKSIRALVVLFVVAALLALVFNGVFVSFTPTKNEIFVGVMVGYETVEEVLKFVDEVKEYVNLIIISSLKITKNATELYGIFDYLKSQELHFIPFMNLFEFVNDRNFFVYARQRWGEYFLGVYTFDEPGGKQIDLADPRPVYEAQNYSDAASQYMQTVAERGLMQFASEFNQIMTFTIFTSDYALYWFDNEACYNVVLTQFGWNHSRQLHIALCRGAATGHMTDWGAIVTWTYRQPPYLDNPDELLNDMILAYNNGAKYIVVFNFPTNVSKYGVLTSGHLEAMQKFWNYQKRNSPPKENPADVAYVLPNDYGYGFRGSTDQIWGLWGPDELSPKVWSDVNLLLEAFGPKLDIIYEAIKPSIMQYYKELFFWNGTTISNS